MTFRRQLIVGHTALLFLTIVMGTVAVIALRTVSSRLERITHDHAADVDALHELRTTAEEVVATGRAYAFSGDADALAKFDDVVVALHASLAVLDQRRDELGVELVRVDEAARGYLAVARHAAHQREVIEEPGELVRYFEHALIPARERFEAAVSALAQREQDDFGHASLHARDFAESSRAIVIVASTVALLLGTFLAWTSIRSLGAHYKREHDATQTAQRAIAARDELLAICSHDLRGPLSNIDMATTLLADDVPADQRKYLDTITHATTHMQHMIEELLDLARVESGLQLHRAPCKLADLVDATASMFELRARSAGIGLVKDVDAALTITVDRERVVQVLANLLGNAFKYTPTGGTITVTARADSRGAICEVADTGPGVPPEHHPRLFDRYWQGRPRGRGSLGLGLYICKQLVEQHGGQIGVESTPGSGAKFWFSLPTLGGA